MTKYYKFRKAGMVTYGLCFLLYYIANVLSLSSTSLDNMYFGPYDLFVESLVMCKGKRLTNLASFHAEMDPEWVGPMGPKNGQFYLKGNSTNLKSGPVVRSKIRTWKWSGKRFEKLLDINSDNICDYQFHKKYVLDPVILVDQQCKMIKGFKAFSGVDFNNITRIVMGTFSAAMGRLKSRVTMFISSGDFLCFDAIYRISPSKIK